MLRRYWATVLHDYTSRELTNPRDKLSALAGLAERARSLTVDEYCAGLWRSYLAEGILWRRENERFLTPAASYRAPSWSWASMDGQIRLWAADEPFHDDDFSLISYTELQIKDMKIQYDMKDSLGIVEGAFAKVSGPFKELQWLPEEFSWDVYEMEVEDIIRQGPPIHYFLTDDRPQQNLWTCYFDCDTEGSAVFDKPLWLLRTHTYITLTETTKFPVSIKFGALILQLAENQEHEKCYKRVGMACFSIGGSSASSRERLASRPLTYGYKPWRAYNEPWGRKDVILV